GGNLTLKCTLTGRNLFRSVQWYKGLDRNQAPIYSDKRGASNRGVRVIPGSTRDFSINIQNVHPEDAGTYYCVKFTTLFTWRELASGKGTLVSVTGSPNLMALFNDLFGFLCSVPPKVHLEINPPSSIQLNTSVMVTCNVDSFYPNVATVVLFAKGAQAKKGMGLRTSNPDGIFSLKSSLEMMSTKVRNFSMFLCQVQHDSQSPINKTTTLFITRQPEGSKCLLFSSENLLIFPFFFRSFKD
ncbi:hypothetical protein E2320_009471, partial [Naja naja]